MSLFKKYFLSLFLFIFSCFCLAQNRAIDSLKEVIRTARLDTVKIMAMLDLSWEFKTAGQHTLAMQFARYAETYSNAGNYKRGLAAAYKYMGNIYEDESDYTKSLEYFLRSLSVSEEIHDKIAASAVKGNIGVVYMDLEEYEKALSYMMQSLQTDIEMGDKKNMALSYNNIGIVYEGMEKSDEAVKYYELSLKTEQEVGNKQNIGNSLNNIGLVYLHRNNYGKALKYFFDSQKVREEVNDRRGIAGSFINIGYTYLQMKNYAAAEKLLLEGMRVSEKIKLLSGVQITCEYLSDMYAEKGVHEKALEYYKKYIAARDSIYNEENTKKMVRTEMQYNFDKKEAEAKAEQERKDAVALADKKRQNIVLLSISGFGLLILAFAVFAYRSFLQKKKANEEISKQKELIEEKQKEILDSIYYASRIQRSLLTNEKYIEKNLQKLRV